MKSLDINYFFDKLKDQQFFRLRHMISLLINTYFKNIEGKKKFLSIWKQYEKKSDTEILFLYKGMKKKIS